MEGEHVLIDDLKALLDLKHQIQTIKEESKNQNMGEDIRQIRLQELEVIFFKKFEITIFLHKI